MSAAHATDASLLNDHPEWRLLSQQPYNVLIEGPVTATDAVLRLLKPYIRGPMVWQRPPAALDLPWGEAGALILTDAAALSREEQRRLLDWMNDTGSRTQIITTAANPLFAFVAAGLFDASLYYRLNVLLLRVAWPVQRGLPSDDAGPASAMDGERRCRTTRATIRAEIHHDS